MSRILLVAPKFDSEFSRARKVGGASPYYITGSLMTPLHLATIAALTPEDWEVEIWDEGAHGEITDETNFERQYDLVGTTAYIAHLPRAIELARIFRRRGIPVAIGGPGVSAAPEQCRTEFDVVFLGEAEYTWPRFLKEFRRGQYRSEYRQVERPDLSHVPVPRWDLVKDHVARYRLAGVQTTRGCPFDCDFCDVIHLFGRKPRHRPIDVVLEEVSLLNKYGASRVFFCDDDFIGDFKYTRDLLRELVPLNNSFEAPILFSTQLTIDLAKHDDIMKLMADANFGILLCGIETPRRASLTECNKVQNLQRDLVEDIQKIQAHGLILKSALILGFDNDDLDIFQEQIDFIERANITATTINTIKTYPGTPQWLRMQQEGRVLDVSEIYWEAPKTITNIIPKQMTMREFLEGYKTVLEHARSWETFERRVKAMVSSVNYVPNTTPIPAAIRMQRANDARAAMTNVPPEIFQTIVNILQFTMTTKPHMVERVAVMIGQLMMDWNVLPYHKEMIDKEIEMFEAGRFKLDIDKSAGMIPLDFDARVKEVLPMLYNRLSAELDYKPAIQEALVAIMKDFLIRWGSSFDQFEDFHIVYLNELCDRHVERWNGRYADGNGTFEDNVLTLKAEQAVHFRFVREVLVAVEQDLRGELRDQVRAEQGLAAQSAH